MSGGFCGCEVPLSVAARIGHPTSSYLVSRRSPHGRPKCAVGVLRPLVRFVEMGEPASEFEPASARACGEDEVERGKHLASHPADHGPVHWEGQDSPGDDP